MKILVLLRGQPRANATLYHENLKALDEWDADWHEDIFYDIQQDRV